MHRIRLRLATTAFLMLFVELALIRWLGANIVYLAYFSNFLNSWWLISHQGGRLTHRMLALRMM